MIHSRASWRVRAVRMSVGSDKVVPLGDHWSRREVDEKAFKDARLGQRCGDLLCRLSDRMGGTIPLACQDWASTKAAYRFFSNPRVEERDILTSYFEATNARYSASQGPILVLQDTTEFTFQRRKPHDAGFNKSINSGRDKDSRLRHHAVWDTDAFQPGRDRGRAYSRAGRRQVLEPRQV